MKKFSKKIMLSILTVALTFIALGTSTFAWFSMNNAVSVTGMKVHTQVGDNLLIADGNPSGTSLTAKPDDSAFKVALVQERNALLEPVSTIDGVAFFYNNVNNVEADGHATAATYTAYDHSSTTAFNTNYGTDTAVGYVEYELFLRATNTKNVAQDVKLVSLDLTYGGSSQTQTAFRVAIFVSNMGETGATAAVAASSLTTTQLVTILKPDGATYFNSTAVKTIGTKDAVNGKIDDDAVIGTVDPGKNNYYKVTIRLWLEGEDTTCNNTTFANLNDEWSLDAKFIIDSTTAAVNEINQEVTSSKEDLSAAPSSAAAATNTIAGVSYYPIDGHTSFYLTNASTAVTNTSKVYKIVDGKPYDVTNQCKLPTA